MGWIFFAQKKIMNQQQERIDAAENGIFFSPQNVNLIFSFEQILDTKPNQDPCAEDTIKQTLVKK